MKSVQNGIYSYPCKKSPHGVAYGFKYVDRQHKQHKQGGFKRRADAVRARAQVISDMDTGKYIDPQRGKTTVGVIGAEWLEGRKNIVKQATFDKYESLWNCHVRPKWGDTPIANIVHSDVQCWVGKLAHTLSPKQTASAYSVLHMILQQAVKDRRIHENPCVDIQLPRAGVRKSRTYLSMDQLIKLAKAASHRKTGDYETMVLFMGTTGMRFGETTALRVKNIDFEKCMVRVCENAVWSTSGLHVSTAKNGNDRVVPFPKWLLADRLRQACLYKDPEALVFERPDSVNDGDNLTVDDYMRPPDGRTGWFVTSVREAGLPRMTMHGLRHTAVSIAIHEGISLKVVQRVAGHSSATLTVDYYADLFVEDLHKYGELIDAEAKKILIGEVLDDKRNAAVYQICTKTAFAGKQKSAGTQGFQRFSWQSPVVPPERVELSLSD